MFKTFTRGIVVALWMVVTAGIVVAEQGQTTRKPNIIFILADDLGLDGLSCYGGRFKTPQLDALAAGGIRFETCYSAPLCGPSRCMLMTGRYAFRTRGLTNENAHNPSPQTETGIAKVLKQAGYITGHAGKWRQMGASPGDWGFDEFVTDGTASGVYWTKTYNLNGQPQHLDKEVYEPDVLQNFTVDFIQRHKDKPFFFYYAMHLVHVPMERTPDSAPGSQHLFADNIAYMDKQVGQLLAELDRLKLRENTLVLFSIDNGTAGRSGSIRGREIHGSKGSMWEGGVRVPLIANWKGTTPAGKVNKDLIDFSDMFPTFAELAGAKLPEGVTIDGHSFAPQIKGQPGKPREWIYVQLGSRWYTRDANWKLNERDELFNMKDAPFQEVPVTADTTDAPAMAARKRLQAVLDDLKPTGEPENAKGKRPGKKRGKAQPAP